MINNLTFMHEYYKNALSFFFFGGCDGTVQSLQTVLLMHYFHNHRNYLCEFALPTKLTETTEDLSEIFNFQSLFNIKSFQIQALW